MDKNQGVFQPGNYIQRTRWPCFLKPLNHQNNVFFRSPKYSCRDICSVISTMPLSINFQVAVFLITQETRGKTLLKPREHANLTKHKKKPHLFAQTFVITVSQCIASYLTNALKYLCTIPLPHSMAISFGEKHVFIIRRQHCTTDDCNQTVNGQHLKAEIQHISKKQKPRVERCFVRLVHCSCAESADGDITHMFQACSIC